MSSNYYEERIAFLGEWGPFQWTVFLLLSISAIPNGHVGLSMVFLADTPPHHCRLPEGAEEMPLNMSLPLEQVNEQITFSRCQRYIGAPVNDTSDLQTEGCIDGWEYSKEQYSSTIVSEWDLVCQNDWKVPLSTSLFFLGVLIGSFISGQISDSAVAQKDVDLTVTMMTMLQLVAAALE
ncbi:solute carrier family 22 member 4-like [Protopterus annectens]|uniref:solute carrier family 22 member 4-like n=1 Tax=Protopterus annectens TaxID=7888 RepID=UPI001CFB858A|nr:solute carrier family 22 member 4-like [Protopterus annectens]